MELKSKEFLKFRPMLTKWELVSGVIWVEYLTKIRDFEDVQKKTNPGPSPFIV